MVINRINLRQFAFTLASLGAVLQIIVAAGIIFLPIIALCGTDGCRYISLLSYLRGDMPPAGRLMVAAQILLVVVPGLAVLASSRSRDPRRTRLRCWLSGIISLLVVYTSWMFGLYFLPGALLMFAAGLLLAFSAG